MPHNVYDSLTLSDDAAIESVITGIPLFCIGIFAIGFFTFLLVLKRVDLLSIFLFLSSFFGFIAAILDLGQILIRGSSGITNGLRLSDVNGFIQAREVLLSMSVGTVFLFYWKLVGRKPFGSTSSQPLFPNARTTRMSAFHCGKWERWGYVGLGLKWLTIVICVLIPILQIVWRVDPKHHQYDDLYVAASVFETTISIIFILKIFLNLSLTSLEERRQVFVDYTAPICALATSTGHGIGNLVLFAFSETTLGRFLRAIEVYILLVWFLIVTFRHAKATEEELRHKSNPSVEKAPLPYFEPVTQLSRGPKPVTTETTRQGGATFLKAWRPNRDSTVSKVGSWVSNTRFNQLFGSSREAPQDTEAAPSPEPEPSLLFRSTPEPVQEKKPTDLREGELLKPPASVANVAAVREGDRPYTEISLSYYAMEGDFRPPSKSMTIQDAYSIGSDSPVYGLDGIIPPRRPKPAPESIVVQPPTIRSAATSEILSPIDQLMQQQSDLDMSISKLRGLHNRQTSVPVSLNVDMESKGGQIVAVPRRESAQRNTILITPSFTSFSKPISSASERSEFSLSNFPDPPEGNAPPPISKPGPKVGIIPIQIPPLDISYNPASPFFGLTGTRFDSAGTQFDVTSFIGGFAAPDSGYTTGGNLASSSLYRTASIRDDDTAKLPPTSAGPAPPSTKVDPPTTAIRPPATPTSASSSPTKSHGLGKATMSSSFKAVTIGPVHSLPSKDEREAAGAQNAAVADPRHQRQASLALRPFLERAGSTRVTPPSGPRSSTSASLARSRSDTIPF